MEQARIRLTWDPQETIKALQGASERLVHAYQKATAIISAPQYERIMCSVSGGSDSDVMMDLLWRVDQHRKITYCFFNTGVEYRATLEHLDDLEERYGVKIERVAPVKSIPVCVREYGQPVISKHVSEQIERLQAHGFQWDDLPLEELQKKYPDCPPSPLRWWSNKYTSAEFAGNGLGRTMFNIDRNRFLRDWILLNPPTFKVSSKCCSYAKKKPSARYIKQHGIQLLCTGVRTAEGGIRSAAYTSCFSPNGKLGVDAFRPVFWFTDEDKQEWCKRFGVEHSRCYTQYGLQRTGCTGCPYNRRLFEEIGLVQCYEPQMVKAASAIFREAYEWTRGYREYAEMRSKGFCQLRMI